MPETVTGRVIAAFGRQVLVRTTTGEQLRARPFGRALIIVCGDQVRCRIDAHHEEVHVIEVLPRRTALYRASARGATEPVVANLTQLLVVLAPLPVPDFYVVDRYLAAATDAGVAATLVVNKSDLGLEAALRAELDVLCAGGLRERAHLGRRAAPASRRCAPPSPRAPSPPWSGSRAWASPRWCAYWCRRRRWRSGSWCARRTADTPPRRRASMTCPTAPPSSTPRACATSPPRSPLSMSARSDSPRYGASRCGCRFADCRHMREPGCAVQAAAASGAMSARRYESYRRLRRLYEELTAARGPGRQG